MKDDENKETSHDVLYYDIKIWINKKYFLSNLWFHVHIYGLTMVPSSLTNPGSMFIE